MCQGKTSEQVFLVLLPKLLGKKKKKKKKKNRESESYLWVSTFAQAEKEIREKQQEER